MQLIEKALFSILQKDLKWVHTFVAQHLHTRSIIEHEWILKLLVKLSEEDKELVYTWLMEDFPHHFFEYTSLKEKNTSYACDILMKFSRVWTSEQFCDIEDRILGYHEPDELVTAKRRFERGKESKCMDFTPYWGNLQNELLPCLDSSRVKQKTKDLINVLHRRNETMQEEIYAKNHSFVSRNVRSPISDRSAKLSDAAWREILSTYDQDKRKKRGRYWSVDGIDSSPESFASSFQSAMSEKPERFLNIVMKLPSKIERCYIIAILQIIAQPAIFDRLPFETVVGVIRYFVETFDSESDVGIIQAFCEILKNNCCAEWPNDFYEQICFLAQSHPDPAPGQYHFTSRDDPDNATVQSLVNNSLNCIRGRAFYTISCILQKRPELEMMFLDTIQQGLKDCHPAVRYSLLNCLANIYSTKREQVCDWFRILLQKDIRFLKHPMVPYLVLFDFAEHSSFYCEAIEKAFDAADLDLVKISGIIAAALYKEKGAMENIIFRSSYTESQAEGLGIQLAYYATSPDTDCVKRALLYLLERCTKVPDSIFRKIFDEGNILRIDPEILEKVACKKLSSENCWMAVRTFKELNSSAFYKVREIVYLYCVELCSSYSGRMYSIIEDFPKVLLRLLDLPSLSEEERVKYLSLFDMAYKSSILTTHNLLKEMEK